jgi:hypothetical protein
MDETDRSYNEFMAKQAREREDFDKVKSQPPNIVMAEAVEEGGGDEGWGWIVVILGIVAIPFIILSSPFLIGFFIVAPILIFLWNLAWAFLATVAEGPDCDTQYIDLEE